MATETTLGSLGHLLVSNALKDRCRRQSQLCETHCLRFEKTWFDNFEEKSHIHQGKRVKCHFLTSGSTT